MLQTKGKILLIEEDQNLGLLIRDFLELAQYHVVHKNNGKEGLAAFRAALYDLVILDIGVSYPNGLSLTEEIRLSDPDVPLVFITSQPGNNRIKGYRTGVDDYVVKPFSIEELKLRVKTMMGSVKPKLPEGPGQNTYSIGSFTFDYRNQLLLSPTLRKRLTKREAEVLNMLCRNKNQVLRRDLALKTIWGEDDYFMGRSMDVYITKLRKMLKDDPKIAITNIHKTGFMLEVKE